MMHELASMFSRDKRRIVFRTRVVALLACFSHCTAGASLLRLLMLRYFSALLTGVSGRPDHEV